jgi:two-component system copper resistance phosphate regulon response regulator CusR
MATINPGPILIIEDDLPLAFVLRKRLEARMHKIIIASNGRTGLEQLQTGKFALGIVDVGLPEINGLKVIETLRRKGVEMPLIIITSLEDEDLEKETYLSGANLFHRKPLNFELLEIQAESLLSQNRVTKQSSIQVKDLELDFSKRTVNRKGKRIKLTRKEFDLLGLLLSNPGDVFSREDIIVKVNRSPKDINQGSIDTLVSRLRKKIGSGNGSEVVETVHGVGYRLNLQYL